MRSRALLVLLAALVATLLAPPASAAPARSSDGCWTSSCGLVDAVRVASITRLHDGRIRVRYENRRAVNPAADIRLAAEFPAQYRQPRIDSRPVAKSAGWHTMVLNRPRALFGEVHVLLEVRARNHVEQRGWRRVNTPQARTWAREVTAAEASAQSLTITAMGVLFKLTGGRVQIAARAGATYGGFTALSDLLESNAMTCPGRLVKGRYLRHVQRLSLEQGRSGIVQRHQVTMWHSRGSYDRRESPMCTGTAVFRY